MAKITDLTELSVAPDTNDLIVLEDVSATTTKKHQITNLFKFINQVTGTNPGTAGGTANYATVGNLKICWGTSAVISTGATVTTANGVTFPIAFASTPVGYYVVANQLATTARQIASVSAISTTAMTIQVLNFDGALSGSCLVSWYAIGV